MPTPALLIDWLNKEMERRDWSMREASRRAGLAHNTISLYVRGERTPDPEVCAALADAFGVTTEYVMYLAGHIEHDPSRHDPTIEAIARRIGQIPDPTQRELVISTLNTLLEKLGY